MTRRALCLTVVLLAFWTWLDLAAQPAPPPARETLQSLPLDIDGWTGRNAPPLEARVLEILGADEYIVRTYERPADAALVGLYIGYHKSQRQDSSIHSPMSCLPGAGWIPVGSARIEIPSTGSASTSATPARVNRVIVQKGEDKQLVLYWYQSQGRVVASEYVGKALLFVDAVRTGRSDAGLIRIMSPMRPGDEANAERAAVGFAASLLPVLPAFLPN